MEGIIAAKRGTNVDGGMKQVSIRINRRILYICNTCSICY